MKNKTRMVQIKKDVQFAMENAQQLNKINDHTNKQKVIVRQFLKGTIGADECEKKVDTLDSNIQEIICYNLEEFIFALRCIKLSQKDILIAVEHESAHFNEAIAQGLFARFCVRVDKSKDGIMGVSCGTQININFNNLSDDEKKRKAIKASIAAPHDLSPSDEQLLS